MNTLEATAIPYERQAEPETNRACGAACLSMVYRSFGMEVTQDAIWPAIAKETRFGSLSSTTHLMARDALSRGFAAVALQTRHALQTLRICRDSGIRAILNHRLTHDTPTGHYSVLVDIDNRNVVLHDPFFGPSRCLSHTELLELWLPRLPGSEIVGNVLIAVATEPPVVSMCQLCRTSIPANIGCPRCKKPVGLQPGVLIGCMSGTCVARLWNYICCPACDYTWNFSDKAFPSPLPPGAHAAPSCDTNPWMKPLFAEIDRFCGHVLGLPGAANHPDIKQLVEQITASKGRIELAQSEALAYQKMARDQLTKMWGDAKQMKEAHRKKMEELNRPSPPLDANALGHALLKNLGFIK